MCDAEAKFCPHKKINHHHGIDPTTYSQEDPVISGEKFMLPDKM
jgi:hypothetical protein